MASRTLSRRDVLVRATGLAAAVAASTANGADASQSPPARAEGVTPFKIDIPRARINRIMALVRDTEWPDAPDDPDPWAYGTSLPVMKDLVQHWLTRYDWRARQAQMNRLPQFTARVEDYDIHFVHVRGSGPNPRPIILSHGWPNTFLEFAKVIDPLAHPEAYGGRIEDAFSVVVPSLPGYAFSSKPRRPIGAPTTARLWDRLMTNVLGYRGYIAQGGDLGFTISREIGYLADNCKAIHLNHLLGIGAPSITSEEKAAEAKRAGWTNVEGAYMAIQRTKPLTISYAMSNSPVGVAAWILEKVRAWSGLEHGDPWSVFTRKCWTTSCCSSSRTPIARARGITRPRARSRRRRRAGNSRSRPALRRTPRTSAASACGRAATPSATTTSSGGASRRPAVTSRPTKCLSFSSRISAASTASCEASASRVDAKS
jgi:microsomal epoxide hydrolase